MELFCFSTAVFYMYTRRFLKLDFLCIGLLAVGTGIALSEKSSIHTLFSRWWSGLPKLSVTIYVSHLTVRDWVLYSFYDMTYEVRLTIYLALVITYALLLWVAVKEICKFMPIKWLRDRMFKI